MERNAFAPPPHADREGETVTGIWMPPPAILSEPADSAAQPRSSPNRASEDTAGQPPAIPETLRARAPGVVVVIVISIVRSSQAPARQEQPVERPPIGGLRNKGVIRAISWPRITYPAFMYALLN